MRGTSYTAKGHSSTWANPWSTSSRSVSGCQTSWQTTSRRKTRMTVKLGRPRSLASSYSTICNRSFLTPSPTCCHLSARLWSAVPACAKGLTLQPVLTLCWLTGGPVRTALMSHRWQQTNHRCGRLISLSAIGLNELGVEGATSCTPSGGRIEDQHNVHWGMHLRSRPRTLIERFAAQNIPCEDRHPVHYV